jgi:hypothetical protein
MTILFLYFLCGFDPFATTSSLEGVVPNIPYPKMAKKAALSTCESDWPNTVISQFLATGWSHLREAFKNSNA